MLILTRRAGESVMLTDTSTGQSLGEVKVLGITPSGVRIGFAFPKNISILRDNARSGPHMVEQEADHGD